MLWGSETPRIWTPPLRELTPETSAGFEVIEFAEQILGITLFPWQKWLLIHALELLESGGFRFRTIILLVARQNGKSLLLAVLSLWWMYVFGKPLTIGTAQNLDVAEEQWKVAVELAESQPDLAGEIEHVDRTNGKKALRLVGGQRYKVAAASRRGGRGLSGDLVLLDELREHQSWDAWAAVTKTTMARPLAQIWGASNAGDAASIVLRHLRLVAHLELGDPDGIKPDDMPEPDGSDVADESLGIFEWSAAPGMPVNDRAGWAQANPSLGHLITEQAILATMRTDPEWVFRMEVLCQWPDHTSEGPFPAGSWEACKTDEIYVPDLDEPTACVDVSWDRALAHVAIAVRRPDGVIQAELVETGEGVDWIQPWFTDPNHPHRASWSIAIQEKRAPASTLIDDLEDAGITVVRWDGVTGTAELYDAIRAAAPDLTEPKITVTHLGQPALDTAAANAATRPVGDMWAWDRRRSPVDISPLVAITGAVWALTSEVRPLQPFVFVT